MPIPPKPYKLICPKCYWSRVCAPKSDALTPYDMPRECPECGADDLVKTSASVIEQLNGFVHKLN